MENAAANEKQVAMMFSLKCSCNRQVTGDNILHVDICSRLAYLIEAVSQEKCRKNALRLGHGGVLSRRHGLQPVPSRSLHGIGHNALCLPVEFVRACVTAVTELQALIRRLNAFLQCVLPLVRDSLTLPYWLCTVFRSQHRPCEA